jgi:gliding motility-associated-like protein
LNFSVAANGISTLSIPIAEAYSSVSEAIENKGLIVSASDTISLYIANEATNSFDASNVLPTETLGDEYIIQSYTPSPNGPSSSCSTNFKSCFIIIATENNTIIDIIPSCTTVGNKLPYNNYPIYLNKGQSYQVMSKNRGTSGNLSGTIVKARNCKKIAVFNGNVLTGVPTSPTNGFDHIFEQAMPTLFWGNHFAITNSKTRQGDYLRITASANNTQITINNTIIATINQYATYEYYLTDTSSYLETSKPAAVYLYQLTGGYDNSSTGDPSMVWITPIEQQIKEITFGTFTAHNTINHHYINIVTSTADISSVTLNNANISTQFMPLNGNPALSFARIEITHGTHTIRNTGGFTAFVYGLGNVRGYAYSVGSSAIDLRANITANGQMLSNTIENSNRFCLNDTLHFKLNTNYEYDSIFWDLGNGTFVQQTHDTITSFYTTPGLYQTIAIVKLAFANCSSNIYDTIQAYLNIIEIKDTIRDTTCYGHYNENGFSFDANKDTVAMLKATNWLGCDSIIILHLHVINLPIFEETLIACHHSVVDWHNKPLSTSTVGTFVYWDSLKTVYYHCDSIHKLTFIVKPTYFFYDTQEVCQNSIVHWHNVPLPTSDTGIFTVKASLQTVDGACDSIYELTLTVKPVYFIIDTMTVCYDATAEWRNRSLVTSISGIFTIEDSLKTVDGCDSIYKLTLIVLPFYFFTDTLTVCLDAHISWRNQLLSTSAIGTFIYWDSLKTYIYACDSIYKLTLIIEPLPKLDLPHINDTICPRTKTEAIAFTGTAAYYEWVASGDNIGIPMQIQRGNFGTYTVTNNSQSILKATIRVTPKTDYGSLTCTGLSDEFTISVYPDISIYATANDSLYCEGTNIAFEVINHHELTGIRWSSTDGFSSFIPNPVIMNVSLKQSGIYIVDAITKYNCDAVSDTVIVIVLPIVILDMEDSTFTCRSEALISSNAMHADRYLWSTGAETENITVTSTGKYWVRASNQRCETVDSTYVTKTNIPDFDIQARGDLCQDGNLELYVDIEMDNLSYAWSTGDTADYITISQNGVYGVAVSFMGCTILQNMDVICPCDLWIPNIFTPNDDSLNDVFIPIPMSVLNTFSMLIYDRWGNLIYRTDAYLPWDGTNRGEYAFTGVYAYIIYYSCKSNPGKTHKKQGRISLIR